MKPRACITKIARLPLAIFIRSPPPINHIPPTPFPLPLSLGGKRRLKLRMWRKRTRSTVDPVGCQIHDWLRPSVTIYLLLDTYSASCSYMQLAIPAANSNSSADPGYRSRWKSSTDQSHSVSRTQEEGNIVTPVTERLSMMQEELA